MKLQLLLVATLVVAGTSATDLDPEDHFDIPAFDISDLNTDFLTGNAKSSGGHLKGLYNMLGQFQLSTAEDAICLTPKLDQLDVQAILFLKDFIVHVTLAEPILGMKDIDILDFVSLDDLRAGLKGCQVCGTITSSQHLQLTSITLDEISISKLACSAGQVLVNGALWEPEQVSSMCTMAQFLLPSLWASNGQEFLDAAMPFANDMLMIRTFLEWLEFIGSLKVPVKVEL